MKNKCKHPLYKLWCSIKSRCYCPWHNRYHRYGGRGIKMCEQWRNSFEQFVADMGERPPKAQIDRINNDGDYEPGNCRWVSNSQNNRNRGNNRILELNGERRTFIEWVEISGLSWDGLDKRLKAGWTLAEAMIPTLRCQFCGKRGVPDPNHPYVFGVRDFGRGKCRFCKKLVTDTQIKITISQK